MSVLEAARRKSQLMRSRSSYTITLSMQNTAGNHWLSFFNSTSWSPLAGAATLFSGLGNAPSGASVYDNSQFIITVAKVEVVDIVLNNYGQSHPTRSIHRWD